MLCSRFKQILFTKTTLNNNVQFRYFINVRFLSKQCSVEGFWATLTKHRKELYKMSSFRIIFRDIRVTRFWSAWSRSVNIGHVVKRCRRDKSVREVIQCIRHAFLRPRRTLLLSATAAYKANGNDEAEEDKPSGGAQGITDEELEALLSELELVDELSKRTLFCSTCSKRMVIDKKLPGVAYCPCKDSQSPPPSPDGWEPYMEAPDVVIWRKEYKPGQGLYAYKVYGRYKDVQAQDFAAVNVDGAYRKVWDSAVAALSVVERSAFGVPDQSVLHWEVLWPRLFANRDYVYIRRHKEYAVKTTSPHVFDDPSPDTVVPEERPSVHSNAKRKSMETYRKIIPKLEKDNKLYVIVSRSCTHPSVPESRNAIRVSEYWSHMLIKTIDGPDEMGMEFVLTYYDEPAVGGLPSGVAAWATGRAAPSYLQRMRAAAHHYRAYKKSQPKEIPDFTPFGPATKTLSGSSVKSETKAQGDVTLADKEETHERVKEEDMESSKTGPEMENGQTRDQSTQTEERPPPEGGPDKQAATEDKAVNTRLQTNEMKMDITSKESDQPECEKNAQEDSSEKPSGWWRYLYPFYYFV